MIAPPPQHVVALASRVGWRVRFHAGDLRDTGKAVRLNRPPDGPPRTGTATLCPHPGSTRAPLWVVTDDPGSCWIMGLVRDGGGLHTINTMHGLEGDDRMEITTRCFPSWSAVELALRAMEAGTDPRTLGAPMPWRSAGC